MIPLEGAVLKVLSDLGYSDVKIPRLIELFYSLNGKNSACARMVQTAFYEAGRPLKLGHCYELLSRLYSYKSWKVASAAGVLFSKNGSFIDCYRCDAASQFFINGILVPVKVSFSYFIDNGDPSLFDVLVTGVSINSARYENSDGRDDFAERLLGRENAKFLIDELYFSIDLDLRSSGRDPDDF